MCKPLFLGCWEDWLILSLAKLIYGVKVMAALGLGGDWEGFPRMRVTFYLQSRCGLLRGCLLFFHHAVHLRFMCFSVLYFKKNVCLKKCLWMIFFFFVNNDIFSKVNIFIFHEHFHRVKWPLRITLTDSTPVVMRNEDSETGHCGPLSHRQDQNCDLKTTWLSTFTHPCDLCKPEIRNILEDYGFIDF